MQAVVQRLVKDIHTYILVHLNITL